MLLLEPLQEGEAGLEAIEFLGTEGDRGKVVAKGLIDVLHLDETPLEALAEGEQRLVDAGGLPHLRLGLAQEGDCTPSFVEVVDGEAELLVELL